MDIVFSSATYLAAAIRAGQVSATGVLESHLAQIDKYNPALNAVITRDAGQARKRAREADAALARGQVWGPLHGVPFTLKDAHATAGMRTTTGLPPLDHVPHEDSTVTARLKAAGGILIGKTNVAEMLAEPAQSNNPIFGCTQNAWNLARTPGGSSGGAAAALAAGMTPCESSAHATVFNYTGHPAVVLPYKLDYDGLPLESTRAIDVPDATHLRFRVVKQRRNDYGR